MKIISYNKEIYSKTAIIKAAYHFTDKYYIYLNQDNDFYYVDVSPKDGINEKDVDKQFSNELLAQVTREEILKQTSNIRELVLGRAFASTIIENVPSNDIDADANLNNDVFEDWYKNDK